MIHRPSIIAPRCPTCGGFTRDWLRMNRRWAGFASWLHGACECCACDPETIDVTISGISRCSGCINVAGGVFGARLMTISGTLDGTYSVVKIPPLAEPTAQYVGEGIVPDAGTFQVYEADCASTTFPELMTRISVHVTTRKQPCRVEHVLIRLEVFETSISSWGLAGWLFAAPSLNGVGSTYDFGESMSNNLTPAVCGSVLGGNPQQLVHGTGGTVVVSR